jgi:hypothetical protein
LGRLHLLPVAIAFLRAYPEIDLKVTFADKMVDLLEEHVDLALRIGALPDSGLFAVKLGTIRHIVCASPAYLAEHGVPCDLAELETHVCVAFQTLSAAGRWKFKTATITPRARLVVNTAEAAIDAAIAGVGVTRVLSYQAETAIRSGALAPVLEAFEPPPLPVSLVHSGERLLPLKLRAFLDPRPAGRASTGVGRKQVGAVTIDVLERMKRQAKRRPGVRKREHFQIHPPRRSWPSGGHRLCASRRAAHRRRIVHQSRLLVLPAGQCQSHRLVAAAGRSGLEFFRHLLGPAGLERYFRQAGIYRAPICL